ncbi:Zn-ribbon domain-containing OB-fold protein [Arvimicrobium flavum]|uniref:Zn-ribbon domain-containing OB-fold protein n=1 Tax=Arvimicrobium flavum TaxID=3393320 RepID=UPI00237B9803|nr:zinc ribbon domain-containing protein [Mesorhizobium shangrilense]
MTNFRELAPYRGYLDGLARGVLRFMRCNACESSFFPPRIACTKCGSPDVAWSDSEGRGTVYSATQIGEPGSAYNVVLIDVDEGFRLMSTVPGVPDAPPIGLRVRASVEAGTADKAPRLVFHPEGDPT